jgi:tetratricopeptide (TPR) repeat protein
MHDTLRLDAYYTFLEKKLNESNHDTLTKQAQELLNFAVASGHRKYQGLAYFIQGDIHKSRNNHVEAIKNYSVAQKIFELFEMRRKLAGLHWDLGLHYGAINDYDRALENNLTAIEYLKELDPINYNHISGILNNIGILYRHTEQHEKALEYFKLSGEYARKVGIVNDIAELNIVYRYLSLGRPADAMKVTDQILRDTQLIDEDDSWRNKEEVKLELLNAMGDIYLNMKDYSKAREYYLQRLNISGDVYRIKAKIGETYLGENDPSSAVNWIEPHYISKYSDNIYSESRSKDAKLLYRSYKVLERPNKALYYLEEYQNVKDSLDKKGIKRQRAMTLLRAELENEMKKDSLDNVNTLFTVQQSHQEQIVTKDKFRNTVLGLCALLAVLLLGLYYRYKLSHRTQKLLRLERDMNSEVLKMTLPGEVANELRTSGKVSAKEYDLATIIFTDFVGFTKLTEHGKANELISRLNMYFGEFD